MATINNKTGKVEYSGGEALPTPGTQSYANAQRGVISPIQNSPTVASTPSTINPTVDGAKLGNTNTLNLPQPTAATTTGNLGLANNSAVSSIKADSTYEPPVNPDKASASSGLKDLIAKMSGQAADVNKINEEAQVAAKKQKAVAISHEMDILDKEFQDQVKAIKENPEGKFGGAVAQDLAKAKDFYENRRANISLAYKVANDDYLGAQEIATEKINALKDQNTQSLQAYQLLLNSINNDMTESEKVQAQFQLEQKKSKNKLVEDAYASALQAGADNKAGAAYYNAIDKAKESGDIAGIMATVGQYGFKTLDQQKDIASINASNASANASNALANQRSVYGGAADSSLSPVTQAVVDNPNLLNNLTTTVKGKVITELQMAGYDTSRLGAKPLSDTAIAAINQSNTALTSLDDLKYILESNKDKLGPVKGIAALNPYSESRKIQADINRVRQQVGKALEGGVLRKEDEEKYKTILSTITDVPETALYKLEGLRTSIQKSIDDYQALQTGAGKSSNVTGPLEKKGDNKQFKAEYYRSKYGY